MTEISDAASVVADHGVVQANHLARNSYSRVVELDGIRALAIWMVMLTHALVAFPYPETINRTFFLIVGHGWLGVDLFFVLSGFLITGILLDAKGKPDYFKTFYARRFLRIMPLYFTVVIIWALVFRAYGSFFLLSSVFLANLAPLFHIKRPHVASVLWSLAIEEQFYLVWPWLVLLLSRRRLAIVAGAIVVVEPIIRAIHAYRGMDPDLIYLLTWCRCDGLATGALLAIWIRSSYFSARSSLKLATYLLIGLVVLTLVGLPFGIMRGHAVAASSLRYTQAYLFFGACFAFVLGQQGTVWTAPLRWRFLVLSGALSYCLYLIHGSVFQVYENLIGRHFPLAMWPIYVRAVVATTAAFLLAMLSKRYLEDPCLRLKDQLFPSQHRPNVAFATIPNTQQPRAVAATVRLPK